MSEPVEANLPRCAECGAPDQEKICLTPEGRGPEFCPTLHNRQAVDRARRTLSDPATREFARRMGFKRFGVVFCEGLRREANAAARVFERQDFEVVSAVCKVGGIPKEEIGLRDDEKIEIGAEETMCNPLAQAELMNHSETELNVLIGLCVGHDMLFTQHCQAPVTTLIVKDRMLAHNPVISLYSRYHKDLV